MLGGPPKFFQYPLVGRHASNVENHSTRGLQFPNSCRHVPVCITKFDCTFMDPLKLKFERIRFLNIVNILVFSGLCRALSEKDYTLVGRVRIAGTDSEKNSKVPLLIGPRDLHLIHQKVFG